MDELSVPHLNGTGGRQLADAVHPVLQAATEEAEQIARQAVGRDDIGGRTRARDPIAQTSTYGGVVAQVDTPRRVQPNATFGIPPSGAADRNAARTSTCLARLEGDEVEAIQVVETRGPLQRGGRPKRRERTQPSPPSPAALRPSRETAETLRRVVGLEA